jgi:hypothetical protein
MTLTQIARPSGAVAAVVLLGLAAGMSITSLRVSAASSEPDSRVQMGFALAPVPLNMRGKNPALVGKGSFIVNAQGDCNGCHNNPLLGGEWADGHNPYFGQPKMVNPDAYLAGGTPFGPFPGVGTFVPANSPAGLYVYTRNLTPGCDSSPCTDPLPEGGTSFQDFVTIMRTGHDFDNAHPACPTMGVQGCIASPPFDANLLQVMPWPVYGNMSDDDLAAIYEYLRAIPCISNAGLGLPANLVHFCPQ